MSNLLFDDRITPCPHYASVVLESEDKAMFLQQLYYWLQKDSHALKVVNGVIWVKCSLTKWLDNFRWWSRDKLKRVIKSLETDGYIFSQECNARSWDRTKIYTLNYDKIAELQAIINQKRELDDMKFSTPKSKTSPSIGAKCTHAEVQNQPLSIKSIIKSNEGDRKANAFPLIGEEKTNEKHGEENLLQDNEKEKLKVISSPIDKEKILEAVKSKVATKKISKGKKDPSTMSLWGKWSFYLQEYKGIRTVNPTGAELGWLKNIEARVTDIPIDEFLQTLIEKWGFFANFCDEKQSTRNSVSNTPKIGAVIAFLDLAYTFVALEREKALKRTAERIMTPPKIQTSTPSAKTEQKVSPFNNRYKLIEGNTISFAIKKGKLELTLVNGDWFLNTEPCEDLADGLTRLKRGNVGILSKNVTAFDYEVTLDDLMELDFVPRMLEKLEPLLPKLTN